MFGSVLVYAAFATCAISIASYAAYLKSPSSRLLVYARSSYLVTVVGILAIGGVLLSLILTHQFQYTYVWSYSSRDLPLPLLISTFYAGQEGSFMLWTIYTALIGVLLLRSTSRNGYEPAVMTVYGMIQLSLLVMLMFKSPFKLVTDSFPGQIESGFVPPNGRGLNPLLQNYWMVIHPQVLFSGFASMGVPYAYAFAAMIRKDYRDWIRHATPWLAVGTLILGTGIMLGGFWAYETLGWGGYWGWDPVENSSLVPWLFAVAGLHMMLSQRKTGRFLRTNLVLGMFPFLMVVYSTFLTRSGVLGDTSVHSFVDPGMLVYWLLVGMLGLFGVASLLMFVFRRKEIPKPTSDHAYFSREFAIFLGALTIVALAILVVAGTSSPLITDILYGKKSAVDVSYYATTSLPLGILISLLAGVAQLLWWYRSTPRELLQSVLRPAALAAVLTVLFAIFASHEILVDALICAALFSLFANLQVAWKIVKGNPKFAGGAIAHIGLAVIFIGFVTSSKFDEKHTVPLEQGKPQSVMGYSLTYTGYHSIGNDKYGFDVTVATPDRHFTISPVMYYSSYNEGLMRNPDIRNLYSQDFYLAPLSLEQASDVADAGISTETVKIGERKDVGAVQVRFKDFDFPAHQREAMMEGNDVTIGATLEVSRKGETPAIVVPKKLMHKGEMTDVPAAFGNAFQITIGKMHPDQEHRENSTVEVLVKDLAAAAAVQRNSAGKGDVLLVEASVKPFINLVWAGFIILMAGVCVTIVRRTQDAKLARIRTAAMPSAAAKEDALMDDAGVGHIPLFSAGLRHHTGRQVHHRTNPPQ